MPHAVPDIIDLTGSDDKDGDHGNHSLKRPRIMRDDDNEDDFETISSEDAPLPDPIWLARTARYSKKAKTARKTTGFGPLPPLPANLPPLSASIPPLSTSIPSLRANAPVPLDLSRPSSSPNVPEPILSAALSDMSICSPIQSPQVILSASHTPQVPSSLDTFALPQPETVNVTAGIDQALSDGIEPAAASTSAIPVRPTSAVERLLIDESDQEREIRLATHRQQREAYRAAQLVSQDEEVRRIAQSLKDEAAAVNKASFGPVTSLAILSPATDTINSNSDLSTVPGPSTAPISLPSALPFPHHIVTPSNPTPIPIPIPRATISTSTIQTTSEPRKVTTRSAVSLTTTYPVDPPSSARRPTSARPNSSIRDNWPKPGHTSHLIPNLPVEPLPTTLPAWIIVCPPVHAARRLSASEMMKKLAAYHIKKGREAPSSFRGAMGFTGENPHMYPASMFDSGSAFHDVGFEANKVFPISDLGKGTKLPVTIALVPKQKRPTCFEFNGMQRRIAKLSAPKKLQTFKPEVVPEGLNRIYPAPNCLGFERMEGMVKRKESQEQIQRMVEAFKRDPAKMKGAVERIATIPTSAVGTSERAVARIST